LSETWINDRPCGAVLTTWPCRARFDNQGTRIPMAVSYPLSLQLYSARNFPPLEAKSPQSRAQATAMSRLSVRCAGMQEARRHEWRAAGSAAKEGMPTARAGGPRA
jgi:hypothetical protein